MRKLGLLLIPLIAVLVITYNVRASNIVIEGETKQNIEEMSEAEILGDILEEYLGNSVKKLPAMKRSGTDIIPRVAGDDVCLSVGGICLSTVSGASGGSSIFATSTSGALIYTGGKYLLFGSATSTLAEFEISASSTDGYLYVGSATDIGLIVDETGNIGIGTTAPREALEFGLNDNIRMSSNRDTQNFVGDIQFYNTSSTTKTGLEWYDHNGSSTVWLLTHATGVGGRTDKHWQFEASDTTGAKQGRLSGNYDCDYDCAMTVNQSEFFITRNAGQTNGNFHLSGGVMRHTGVFKLYPNYATNASTFFEIGTSTDDVYLKVGGGDLFISESNLTLSGLAGVDSTFQIQAPDQKDSIVSFYNSDDGVEQALIGYDESAKDLIIINEITGSNSDIIFTTGTAGEVLRLKGNDAHSITGNMTISGTTSVGTFLTPYAQTLHVAKSGGDYTTIQGAIDSITDNTTNKRYAIIIHPGTYTENIVMEEYVSLIGYDHESTKVTSASGVTITAPSGTSDASIANIQIISTPTADGATALVMTAGELDVYSTYIKMTSATNGVNGELVDQTGGILDFVDCRFVYTTTGSSVGVETHSVFNIPSGADINYNIHGSHVDINISDVDDTAIFVNEASVSTTTESYIQSTNIHMNLLNASYAGSAGVFYFYAAGDATKQIEGNHIHITSSGDGTGYLVYIDTANGGGTVNSIGNWANCTGFSTNYSASVAAGDTINGSFLSLMAADGSTGAGTFNLVSSPSVGDLTVTGTTTTTNLTVVTNSKLGTIVSGTWNGTAISNVYGGTGLDSSGWTGFAYVTGGTWSASSTIGESVITDSYLKNYGDVGTGVYDFGGADSFEMVNAAAPTVDATGEFALDTTQNQLVLYGTSSKIVVDEDGKRSFCYDVASSSPGFVSGDFEEIAALDYGITVYKQSCKVKTGQGTTQVVNLSDNGTNDMDSITCATTRAYTDVSTNNTLTALEDFRLEYGTNTGTTTDISFCAYYTITAN